VLFAGEGCGFTLANRLKAAGFNLDSLPYPGLNGKALTLEQVKRYNVLVVAGLGNGNADLTLTDKNKANIEVIRRFLDDGGGVFIIPVYGQITSGIPPQSEFLKPLGLVPLFEDVPRDPDHSVNATAWKIDSPPPRTSPPTAR